MKQITSMMIKEFKIDKLGIDMMGYRFKRQNDLSFHHLIVPKRNCKAQGLGNGYYFWNGAILTKNPQSSDSHDYLHLIEHVDYDVFCAITSELIDENMLRRIELQNLRQIHDILASFEREHDHDVSKSGDLLIKRSYVEQREPIISLERKGIIR